MDIFIRNKPYCGPVRAAVLDWAGTAVDFGCLGPTAVFIEVFKRHGVAVTLAEARQPMGLMKKDHVRAMCRMASVAARWAGVHGRNPDESDVDIMYQETERLLVQSLIHHARPVPGCVEAVAEFKRQGLKIGACTGYTRDMLNVLAPESARHGYAPDASVCSSDVPAGRPHPYMCYLNAIELQVYPMEAMVKIGDTVADIQEGLNAGMWTIGLTKSGNELGLSEGEAAALPADELRSRLAAIEARFREAGAHYVAEGIWNCPSIIADINEALTRGERPLACAPL